MPAPLPTVDRLATTAFTCEYASATTVTGAVYGYVQVYETDENGRFQDRNWAVRVSVVRWSNGDTSVFVVSEVPKRVALAVQRDLSANPHLFSQVGPLPVVKTYEYRVILRRKSLA